MDLTKWAVDELLEDFIKKPIKITIENLSDKYILKGTFQVFKKEGKDESNDISKGSRSNKGNGNAPVVKRSSGSNRAGIDFSRRKHNIRD